MVLCLGRCIRGGIVLGVLMTARGHMAKWDTREQGGVSVAVTTCSWRTEWSLRKLYHSFQDVITFSNLINAFWHYTLGLEFPAYEF